jgi:hypothetical protein
VRVHAVETVPIAVSPTAHLGHRRLSHRASGPSPSLSVQRTRVVCSHRRARSINYLDLDPPLPAGIDRAKSYFGANVQRMAAIMHAYDPEWTFTYGNTVFERLTTYNTYGSSAGCASTPAQPHSEAEFAVLIAVASVLGVMVLGGMGLWRLVRLREQNEKLLQSGLQHADESRKSKALELHNLSRRVSRKGSLQSALGEIHEKSEKL